ncbi:MAG: hypothetical protein ACFFCZ_00185 [Promethearchaeota archaeon]
MELQIREFHERDIEYLVEILNLNNQYENPIVDGPDAMKRVAKCQLPTAKTVGL